MNVVRIVGVALAVVFAGCCTTPKKVVRVSDFGFSKEDSTAILQAAIDSDADVVIVDKHPLGPWYAKPLRGRSNLELVFEDGAEIVAKRGAFKGKTDMLLTFSCCSNVVIRGKGALRMWRCDYVKPPYEKAEWRMALSLGSCQNVLIEDMSFLESGGDGIYISQAGKDKSRWFCENVTIRRVKCLRNHRQGISVIGAKDLLIEDCDLSETDGTSPMAGIDFEPNNPWNKFVNCVVRNCRLENNAQWGVEMLNDWHDATTDKVTVRIENCVMRNNGNGKNSHADYHLNGLADGGPFRSPEGEVVAVNCRVKKLGETEEKPFEDYIKYGVRVCGKDGKRLSPMAFSDIDFSQAVIVDKAPGKRVKLSNAEFRRIASFVFYAPAAGEYSFKARQRPYGKNGPCKKPLEISAAADDSPVIQTIAYPAPTSTVFAVKVPAKGFYKMIADNGWTGAFILEESELPIAIDNTFRKFKARQYPVNFHAVKETTVCFAVAEGAEKFYIGACGGNRGEGQWCVIADPSGRVVFDRDNAELADYYESPEKPMAGIWTIRSKRPTRRTYDDFSFDAVGAPSMFFMTPEKYWTLK